MTTKNHEIELKPLEPDELQFWQKVDSFRAIDAACLMFDYNPPHLGMHGYLRRAIQDLKDALVEKYPHNGGNTRTETTRPITNKD